MTHPDLDELLNKLFPFAVDQLAKSGEFYPFGASMSMDGEVTYLAGHTGDEHPPSREIIDILLNELRRRARLGEIRASGICLDVLTIPPATSKKVDAICARLEQTSGEVVEVFLPYRKTVPGPIEYGEIFAAPGENKVFGFQSAE